MAASYSVDDVAGWLDDRLAGASPDLLRAMVKQFAEALMAAEADAVCGAGYRERSDARVNYRNGYRHLDWDTRAGSIELAIPKLRSGSYFPTGYCNAGAALGRRWSRWAVRRDERVAEEVRRRGW